MNKTAGGIYSLPARLLTERNRLNSIFRIAKPGPIEENEWSQPTTQNLTTT
jgi:hypothetical protein